MDLTPATRPPDRLGSEVMSPTLPLPPPKDVQSLARFVESIASIPRDRIDDIREVFRSIRGRSELAGLLHEQLFLLPATDTGYHLLLLSITGELADPSSPDALEKFVWLTDREVYGESALRPPGPCDFMPGGLLQARAAEMLIWVAAGRRDESVFRILQEHTSPNVRVAAIDAFLYHHDDSLEAIELLDSRVRDDDRWAVGLPRRGAGLDPEELDRLAAAHEATHGEIPPTPDMREGTSDVY